MEECVSSRPGVSRSAFGAVQRSKYKALVCADGL
jgi:hypothetical protein